jgi:hypothetical protein
MSLVDMKGMPMSTRELIASAKEQGKLTALFTPFGAREAKAMDLEALYYAFGSYAEWFMKNVRQGHITHVRKKR